MKKKRTQIRVKITLMQINKRKRESSNSTKGNKRQKTKEDPSKKELVCDI